MKTSIEWKPSWCIGIAPIDVQHRKLVALLGDLERSRSGTGTHCTSVDTLVALSDYIELHFGDEEALMVSIEYPHLQAHREEHARFVEQVKLLATRFRLGQTELTGDVIEFLSQWILQHIAVSDSLVAQYVRSNAINLPPSLTHQPVAPKEESS